MRGLAILVLLSAWPSIALAEDAASPATATLTVTVDHILDDAGGDLLVGLYDKAGFETAHSVPVAGKRTSARRSTMTVTFENLPPGVYAVKAFQDLNRNGNFDVGLKGVEPFGFSNDPPVTVGLPPFDDAKFTVTAGTNSIELTLH
jgi:uncharacterized protein (DUF2141 family)